MVFKLEAEMVFVPTQRCWNFMMVLLDCNAGGSGSCFEAFKDKMETISRLQSSQTAFFFFGVFFGQVFSLRSGLLQREGSVTHWARLLGSQRGI